MAHSYAAADGEKPLFRRVVDFPLVAMVTAVLIYAFAVALALAIGRYVPAMPEPWPLVIRAAITIALALAAYKLAIRKLGEREHDDLRGRRALTEFGLGLAAGFLVFSAVVGAAAAAGVYRIEGPGSTHDFIPDLVAMTLVPAFMEELLFRGILFRWIEEFAGSWAALVLTAALFGLAHIMNPNATWFSSFAIAIEAGLLLGGAYMLTRSLWMPIGLHAAWNFTQGVIFDVPVSGVSQTGLVEARLYGPELLSGGNFGLEASLFALAIATVVGCWLVWLAIRRGQLVEPWWVRRRRLADAEA